MAIKRVTMQDIADACALSRNTVSKAFNGRGSVPAATRALIMQKAAELGYGVPVERDAAEPVRSKENSIALLTHHMPMDYHFGTYFVTTFTDQICRAGYTLKMFEISAEELSARRLPPHFAPEQIAGIVGIELFDEDYLRMICTLGLPTIIIDSPAHAGSSLMGCDFVSMENYASIVAIMEGLTAMGAKRFGFVGDHTHCGSFNERWAGFRSGLDRSGLPFDEKLCILAPDASPYHDPEWLLARLDEMPALPDAFVCANDYLAIHVMGALKRKGLAIPGDIMITGFDGTSQSALVDPALTTVQIPSVEIGRMSANTLLGRIRNPSLPYTWTRIRTTPIWRSSTRQAGG